MEHHVEVDSDIYSFYSILNFFITIHLQIIPNHQNRPLIAIQNVTLTDLDVCYSSLEDIELQHCYLCLLKFINQLLFVRKCYDQILQLQ